MKKVTYKDLNIGNIIVWENHILQVADITNVSNYSARLKCAMLGKNGRFLKKTTDVRLWHDDKAPVAETIKEAQEILAELNKPDENLPFFVYGTLRKGCGNYENYLIGNTEVEMPATVQGLLFHQGSVIPYMTKGEGIVHGELMYIADSNFPKMLEALDRLEGYRKDYSWSHYIRERVTATLEDGSTVEAYAYYYGGGDAHHMIPITSGDYKEWVFMYEYFERYGTRRTRRRK